MLAKTYLVKTLQHQGAGVWGSGHVCSTLAKNNLGKSLQYWGGGGDCVSSKLAKTNLGKTLQHSGVGG